MKAEALHLMLPLGIQAVRDFWTEAARGQFPPLAQQAGEEAVLIAKALGEARRCGYLGCTNLAGISDREVRARRCSGCVTVRFCSTECTKAAWRSHRTACRALAAAAPAQAAAAAALWEADPQHAPA